MMTTTYNAPGIACDHCKSIIEDAVATAAGVTVVEVDIDAKTVSVEGGDPIQVVAAIEDAGYDITTWVRQDGS